MKIRRSQMKILNGFIMLIKSGLHLIIVLLIIFLIFAAVAKFDRSLEIEKRRKNQNKNINKKPKNN